MGFGPASGSMTPQEKKPFKSPLLTNTGTTPFRSPLITSKSTPAVSSPLNPKRFAPYTTPTRPSAPSTPAPSSSPYAPMYPSTPIYFSSGPSTPRSLGMSSRRSSIGSVKKQFTTPFKPGMRPGEPGRLLLGQKQKASTSNPDWDLPSSPIRIIGNGSTTRYHMPGQ